VDSAVAAAVLQEEGHEVIGVHMKLWQHQSRLPDTLHGAGSGHDDARDGARDDAPDHARDDARAVCQALDIPFHSLDFSSQFQGQVVDYFCREYARGRTPNPCVACNRLIKFDLLLAAVEDLGAECLATGHYARIGVSYGNYQLLKAARPSVDQSYFLYTLKESALPRLLFPLGAFSKAQVRQLAAARGLPVAGKPKSQDLCFVPDGRHGDFLEGRIAPVPGDIVDLEGKVLGRHRGIAFYTVGQRTGLGVAAGRRLFVLRLDPVSHTVVVGAEENLLASGLVAGDLSFVCVKPRRTLEVTAKVRFRTPEVSARLKIFTEEAEVLFDQPQRAIAPGQAVVFYHGEEVLGGGIIKASC
jgi:tRNA-specific 2-thiouridylase